MLQKNIRQKKKISSFLIKVLVLFIYLSNTNAQIFTDTLLISGLNKGYNFQFDEANKLFDDYSKKKPDSIKGEFLKSKFKLWKFVGSKSQETFSDFSDSIEKTIIKIEKILDENSADSLHTYLLASCYASKTIALSTNYEIVDAFWAAKKAMSYLEDLIEDYPNFKEPYLEQGILTYALSYVEGFATVALTLSGMEADQEKGMGYLISANKGNLYSNVESSFYLSQVLSEYIADYYGAINYLLPLTEKFPKNILFSFQLAVLYTKNNQLDLAENIIAKILNSDESVFPQTTAFSNFLMGDILLKKGNYKLAKTYFKTFLKKSNDINFSSKAYYQLAICNLFLGELFEVKRNLASTNLGNLENADDKFARRRSVLIQDNSIDNNLINLLKAEITVQNKEFDNAETLLNQIDLKKISSEFYSLFLILKAEIFLENKHKDKFSTTASQIFNLEIDSEKWVIPKINLLMAKIYFDEKKYDKCAEFLDEAESENDYDFRSEIAGQINKIRHSLRIRNYR